MNAYLFANIGNSDIGKNLKPLFKSKRDIYEQSKKLFEENKFSFDAILLEPILNYIKDNYTLANIFLFGTEQVNIHPQDSIYIARIVKKILINKFNIEENKIKIIQITKNPADRDEMYNFYEEFLNSINEEISITFISLTGGTPAQNEALLLNSTKKFGLKIQAVYLPQNSNNIKILKIGEKIYKNFLMREFNILKEKHQYTGAIKLAEEYQLLKNDEIEKLKAINYKLLFDFNNAIKCLEKIKECYLGEEKLKIEKEIENLKKIQQGLTKKFEFNKEYFVVNFLLIKELYENMKIKWEEGAYVDFIGRLFRLEEAILRLLFEKYTQTSTAKIKGSFSNFASWVKNNKELLDFLMIEKIDPNKIEPNRKILRKILEFWVKKENRTELACIFNFINKINTPEGNSLAELRNKSILGHGFLGFSKDTIEKYYKRNIFKDIDMIVNYLLNLLDNKHS